MSGTKKHILKIFGWIFLILILLISGAGIFIFYKAENYIKENLSKIVSDKSNQLYSLQFDKIYFHLTPISVTFSNIDLSPNEAIAAKMAKEFPEKSIYSFHSNQLMFRNIKLISLLKKNTLHCKKITISHPVFNIYGDEMIQDDSAQIWDKLIYELRPFFQNHIKKIIVDEINFEDANYGLYNRAGSSHKVSNAKQISLIVKNFRTDSVLINENNKLFESEDILVRMKDFRNNMGDSLHVLTIDTLEYSLKKSDINARGFRLKYSDVNPQKSLYDVYVPNLYMISKSITHFNLNDSIEIAFLRFEKAEIKFYQKENPKKLIIEDINNFDLYSLIENQLTKIDVDSFILSDAYIEIFRQPNFDDYQQQFKSVDVSLSGFTLDSTTSNNPDKLFNADEIEMTAADYHLRLEDNEHHFQADSMYISTYSNSLRVKGISIYPDDSSRITSHVTANINCESLFIEDVNLKTLYHTRQLPTQKIEVVNPNVRLQYHADISKSEKQQETGLLFELVSDYLKGVYSEFVTVSGGKLEIQNLDKNKIQGYFETNINLNLSGFALDSTSIERTDKLFYATNFDLQFNNYQMKLVDDLHKINVDKVWIQSFENKVEIENLHLQPVIEDPDENTMKQFNRSELYNISVPAITMWGINLRDAFFYNELNISRFRISSPKIYFENFGGLRDSTDKKEFSELTQLIFNYLNNINIKNIEIPNGSLTLVNHSKKGKTISFDNDFTASFENFRLNEAELNKQRLLFSDNFDISIKDQLFQLSDSVHILQAGEIELSTKNASLSIKDALLYPVITSDRYRKLNTTFQVSIPDLQINNFDFLDAYYSREPTLDKLILNGPKIQIYSKAGAVKMLDLNKYKFPLPSFIHSLKINELKVNNAEVLTYETEGIDHHAKSNFRIDLTIPGAEIKNTSEMNARITSDNLIARISDFKTPLGNDHELSFEKLDFNRKEKNISITQLFINPFRLKNEGNQFVVKAPDINLTQFDINEALKENNFGFDKIEINNPDINIEINDSINGDKLEAARNIDLYPYIESYVNQIKINQLNLNHANLNFNWFQKELFNKSINFDFKEINIGENQNPDNFLHSKELEITTTNLKKETRDNLYEFTADSLIYNSLKHNILLKNIRVNPLLKKEEFPRKAGYQIDYLKANSSIAELSGVDENEWIKNNILSAKLLKIGKSNIDIFRNKRYPFNHNQRPPWPQDLIKNIRQSYLFDSVQLMPSYIKYSELLDIDDEPGYVDFNNLTFSCGEISNINLNHSQNKILKINASAKIYNQGTLTVQLDFDLSSKNYSHTVTGSLSQMPLTPINKMLEKSAPIKIESGMLNRFDFNISFDDKLATGELYFGYDDFKVTILNAGADGTKKSKLATFWANTLVLHSKNPKGDTLSPEPISYKRDKERSVINYWWKALLSGAKKVIGIENENSD